MFRNILFVALGGSLGSIFRYLFSLLLPFKKFPFATFSVNIIGSFFIGLFMGYVSKQIHNQSW